MNIDGISPTQEVDCGFDLEDEDFGEDPFIIPDEDETEEEEEDCEGDGGAEVSFTNKAGDFVWTSMKPAESKPSWASVPEDGRFTIDLDRIRTPLAAFLEFFDSTIIERILQYTNAEAAAVDKPGFKEISRAELLAYFGILINAGRMHAKKMSLDDLWCDDTVNGMVFYRAVMGKSRFKEIMRFLRFDDSVARRPPTKFKSTPGTGIPYVISDRLAPIRWLVESLRENFSSKYIPGRNVTIDERMVSYRGRCIFIVYIKAKPHPYGIKLWCITDAGNTFLLFFEVYTGNVDQKKNSIVSFNICKFYWFRQG